MHPVTTVRPERTGQGRRTARLLAGLMMAGETVLIVLAALALGCAGDDSDYDLSPHYMKGLGAGGNPKAEAGLPGPARVSARVAHVPTGKRATDPVDHYLGFFAKDDGASAGRWLERHLWAPCRLEGRLGFFSPARAEGGPGSIGLVLHHWLGEGGYHAVRVRRAGDGIEVSAESDPGGLTGSALLEGLRADVALEHDGTDIVILARAVGAKAYTEVLRRPATGLGPFTPFLEVLDLAAGAEVGADTVRVPANGLPPRPLTPTEGTARTVFGALDEVMEAVYAADGAAPDLAAARNALQLAAAGFTEAAAGSAAIPELAKAGKKVGSLSKSALAIVKAIDGGGAASKVYKSAAKLAQKGFTAAEPYDQGL